MKYLKKLVIVIVASLTALILLACTQQETKVLEDKHKENIKAIGDSIQTGAIALAYHQDPVPEINLQNNKEIFEELNKISASEAAYFVLIDGSDTNKSRTLMNGQKYKKWPTSTPIKKIHEIKPIFMSRLKLNDSDHFCYIINIAGTQKIICKTPSGKPSENPLEIPDIPNTLANMLKAFIKDKHHFDINIDALLLVDPMKDTKNNIILLKSEDYDSKSQIDMTGVEILPYLSATYTFLDINPTCTYEDQNGRTVLVCVK